MKILNNAIIRDHYDVIVIGGGIGGLTAAALLGKRGLRVLTIDQHYIPGGCCTSLRRDGITFDVGAAMLYGWDETGYNPHRFVMNELEEEIDMIPYEGIMRLHIFDKKVTFWRDFNRYFEELVALFPNQEKELKAFYDYSYKMYKSVMGEETMPMPPSETPPIEQLKGFVKNPVGMLQMMPLLYQNTEKLLNKFVSDPNVLTYFDMLAGTFACTNVAEFPALLSAILFVDTHEGGACYPAGSPQVLPNKLEKAIERYGGQILYRQMVNEILIYKGKAYGVRLSDGNEIMADRVISNADIWQLYGKLVKPRHIKPKRMEWAQKHVPTLSSFVLYIGVDEEAIPEDAHHIEMFMPDVSDFGGEENFSVFIPSIDDPSICPPGTHSMTVITNSDIKFPRPSDPEYQSEEYNRLKQQEADRILDNMEKRFFPNLRKHIRTMDIATSATTERFTMKTGGHVGGPKQAMGQEMMKRLKAKSEWENLYLCGDSTVSGEGVVATTSSGIGAANMVLRDMGLQEFLPRKFSRQYVNMVEGEPWETVPDISEPVTEASAKRLSLECQLCENAECMKACPAGIDVLSFARRIEAGNFAGAARSMREMNPLSEICGYICPAERLCEKNCVRVDQSGQPVRIADLHAWVCGQVSKNEGWDRSIPAQNGKKVAVIGAGPAGLSCAHFLVRLGYRVDIMEKSDKPGGMLTRAIPAFRLSGDVVGREIEGMTLPGMRFKYGQALGKDFSVSDLEKDYEAVFLAPGLWSGTRLKVADMKKAKATDALSMLCAYREKGSVKVEEKVLVIGGGSVATDAALAARDSGARKVSLVCLEKEDEMPALPGEVAELKKQGIAIHNGLGPGEFVSDTKMSFVACTSVLDSQGRFRPSFDESKVTEIEFDQLIWAVGQTMEPALAKYLKKEFSTNGLVEVDEETMQVKDRPGVFAGGDIVRGGGTVVEAVADGRRAAMAIVSQLKSE